MMVGQVDMWTGVCLSVELHVKCIRLFYLRSHFFHFDGFLVGGIVVFIPQFLTNRDFCNQVVAML